MKIHLLISEYMLEGQGFLGDFSRKNEQVGTFFLRPPSLDI